MRLARALELTHNIASTPKSIEGLDSLLDPALVEQALEQAGVATLRKRRLPLEMMLWCVISMAFFRRMSAWDVVSQAAGLPLARMLGAEPRAATVGTMTMLMGRAEAHSRRAWLEEHGNWFVVIQVVTSPPQSRDHDSFT